MIYLQDPDFTLHVGDALETLRELPAETVDCALTSPPFYGLRDYGTEGQIGLEATPEAWCDRLVQVFREVRRILKPAGTLWVECGDSYSSGGLGAGGTDKQASNVGANLPTAKKPPPGYKPKDLLGQPWMLAFALRADGWYLRQCIIWSKPNAMPESVRDRCTTAHSYLFLLSKSPRYWFDAEAIAEPAQDWSHGGPGTGIAETFHYGAGNGGNSGLRRLAQSYKDGAGSTNRNARSVWQIPTSGFSEAHFATWPPALVERILKAGCPTMVCRSCGSPWERVVERGESDYARLRREEGHEWRDMDAASLERGTTTRKGEGGQTRTARGTVPSLRAASRNDLGWRPSCSCMSLDVPEVQHNNMDEESVRPGVVLDPFMGSGTTALVARRLGLRSIGIELNPEYAAMCARRLSQLSLLAEDVA